MSLSGSTGISSDPQSFYLRACSMPTYTTRFRLRLSSPTIFNSVGIVRLFIIPKMVIATPPLTSQLFYYHYIALAFIHFKIL